MGRSRGTHSPWGTAGDLFPTESVAPASGNMVAVLTVSRRRKWPVASRTSHGARTEAERWRAGIVGGVMWDESCSNAFFPSVLSARR